jgi:hypothetical protein
MSIFGRKTTGPDKKAEVEGEIVNLVNREVVQPHRQLANDGGEVADSLGVLVQRVSLSSVEEIDRLIADLELLRDQLQQESERMASAIVDYAGLAPVASQSSKIVAEYVSLRRKTSEAPGRRTMESRLEQTLRKAEPEAQS